jgi:Cu(I)/Ag(I) efflux system membrane fusion protein
MFVRARVLSDLAANGQVVTSDLAGKWISPMHPEVIKDGPGQCDVCGMDLVPIEEYGIPARTDAKPPLIVPEQAVLITGKRAIVYVKLQDEEDPTFEGRDIVLGPRAGDYYIVAGGDLREGELVDRQCAADPGEEEHDEPRGHADGHRPSARFR